MSYKHFQTETQMKSTIIFFFLFIQCIFPTAQNLPAPVEKFCAAREVFFLLPLNIHRTFTKPADHFFSHPVKNTILTHCFSGNDEQFVILAANENIQHVHTHMAPSISTSYNTIT